MGRRHKRRGKKEIKEGRDGEGDVRGGGDGGREIKDCKYINKAFVCPQKHIFKYVSLSFRSFLS
jgi:hypothetical protein